MLIPVRCFTCGKVIGGKWNKYLRLLETKMERRAALDRVGMRRYCCRRMYLTHVDMWNRIVRYAIAAGRDVTYN